ncbi:B-box zinc finger protein [Reichenbachiella sp.]|uniref:B-box zinc finger protein n=1 Tax=Reichenbachiella sp. TaxID=2184521 RepID=UPI00398FDCD5
MHNCNKCEKRATLHCRSCGRYWCVKCQEEHGKPGLFAGKCAVCDGIVVRLEHQIN